MKRFFTALVALSVVLLLSASAFACAACFGMATFVELDLNTNIYDSFITCSVAAAAVLLSLGGANLAQASAKKSLAKGFKDILVPTVKDVKETLKYTFSANELTNINIAELRNYFLVEDFRLYGDASNLSVEINARYNGDGLVTDSDACFFDIVKSFSETISVLFSNENIALISMKSEIIIDGKIEIGASMVASKKGFMDNYTVVQSTALIDSYKNMFEKAEAFYVNPVLSTKKK